MRCCDISVNKCDKCKKDFCKHYKSVYSYRLCFNCVSEIVKNELMRLDKEVLK